MTTAAGNVSLASKYMDGAVRGLALAVASNTTLTLGAGSCIDSTNMSNMILDSGVTINAAVNGLNGLDTGSFAASKTYYIYLISCSYGDAPTGAIMSLSASSPLMPSNKYDAYKLIGVSFSDGSTNFISLSQVGNGNYRKYIYDAMIKVLNDGTATSLTAIDLSNVVPAIANTPVMLEVEFTPATANDKVSFANATSTSTVLPNISGVVAAKAQTGQLNNILATLVSGAPKIQYINSAASGNTDVWVYGFEHFI